MNNKQTDKHSAYFARQWLEEMLTMCRRTKGFLYHLRIRGHMSWRTTSFDNTASHLTIEVFLRIMVNLAMVRTKGEFFERWNKQPLRILWYDTEQSDESTQDILKNRIMHLIKTTTDLTDSTDNSCVGNKSVPSVVEKQIDVFNVRGVPWKERRKLLLEAVAHYGPDLVIVDGIRDLVDDINGSWTFNTRKLFNDALGSDDEVQASIFRQRVMQLSGITLHHTYNHLLKQALEEKIIEKTDRGKVGFYRAAPF